MVKVVKPWGWYEDLIRNDNVVVKKIHINPHSRLSLQSHKDRQEFWFSTGKDFNLDLKWEDDDFLTSEITCPPEEMWQIREGEKHRLVNPTDESIEIIEVQLALPEKVCSEDDIIRYEDDYGRM